MKERRGEVFLATKSREFSYDGAMRMITVNPAPSMARSPLLLQHTGADQGGRGAHSQHPHPHEAGGGQAQGGKRQAPP